MKKPAIICDVDGTLSHHCDRGIFDFEKSHADKCDAVVKDIVRIYYEIGLAVLIVSAREDKWRDITVKWLRDNNVPFDRILMRQTKDFRKDAIVKREIYDEYILDNYDVQFVLDDRDQVVKMWRGLGLKCLQVADGNF